MRSHLIQRFVKYLVGLVLMSHRTIISDGFLAFLSKARKKLMRAVFHGIAGLFVDRLARRATGNDERSWRKEYGYLKDNLNEIMCGSRRSTGQNPCELIEIQENRVADCLRDLRLPMPVSPVVSIVIPVFNNVKYTVECILSIVRNTADLAQHELIVIDDGSTDETEHLIGQVANLTYIRNQTNLG